MNTTLRTDTPTRPSGDGWIARECCDWFGLHGGKKIIGWVHAPGETVPTTGMCDACRAAMERDVA